MGEGGWEGERGKERCGEVGMRGADSRSVSLPRSASEEKEESEEGGEDEGGEAGERERASEGACEDGDRVGEGLGCERVWEGPP